MNIEKQGISNFALQEIDTFLFPMRNGNMDGWTCITPDNPYKEVWMCRHDGIVYRAVKIGAYTEISDEFGRYYFEPGECLDYKGDLWELLERRGAYMAMAGVMS